MEEANIEECSNRNVGSIRLDMKEAQNEQLEKVSAVFQFTASTSVKEVVNREGDSTKLDEKEVNKEELEKAQSSASSPAQDAANQDLCSAGIINDVDLDTFAWPDLTAPQFENATGDDLESLLDQVIISPVIERK
jgi:hypothetical protein